MLREKAQLSNHSEQHGCRYLCSVRQSSDQIQSTDGVDSEHQNTQRPLLGVQSLEVVENLLHLRFLADYGVCVDVHGFGVLFFGVIRMTTFALYENELDSGGKLKTVVKVLAF